MVEETNEKQKSVIRLRLDLPDFQALKMASVKYSEFNASVFEVEYDEEYDIVTCDVTLRNVPKKLAQQRFAYFLIRTFKKD